MQIIVPVDMVALLKHYRACRECLNAAMQDFSHAEAQMKKAEAAVKERAAEQADAEKELWIFLDVMSRPCLDVEFLTTD